MISTVRERSTLGVVSDRDGEVAAKAHQRIDLGLNSLTGCPCSGESRSQEGSAFWGGKKIRCWWVQIKGLE